MSMLHQINLKITLHSTTQILESREKKWILIGLLRSVPEKSSLNLTLYMEIALASVPAKYTKILNS